MRLRLNMTALAFAAALHFPAAASAQRQLERPGRGVVAVCQPDGRVRLGRRLLGTDDEGLAFNPYRRAGRRARTS